MSQLVIEIQERQSNIEGNRSTYENAKKTSAEQKYCSISRIYFDYSRISDQEDCWHCHGWLVYTATHESDEDDFHTVSCIFICIFMV